MKDKILLLESDSRFPGWQGWYAQFGRNGAFSYGKVVSVCRGKLLAGYLADTFLPVIVGFEVDVLFPAPGFDRLSAAPAIAYNSAPVLQPDFMRQFLYFHELRPPSTFRER